MNHDGAKSRCIQFLTASLSLAWLADMAPRGPLARGAGLMAVLCFAAAWIPWGESERRD